MRARKFVVMIVFMIAIAAYYFSGNLTGSASNGHLETALGVRAVDGDTIEIAGDERIRLLGINTPEKGQYLYNEAKVLVSELIVGKTLKLEWFNEDKDMYGRLLRYVWADDVFVNNEVVARGLAHTYFVGDFNHASELNASERSAREAGLGIWKPSSVDCVVLQELLPEPDDDETVVLKNNCGRAVSTDGWSMKDESRKVYEFPTIEFSDTLTVHSGKGTDNVTDLFWNYSSSIWNDDSDKLFLRDKESLLILYYAY